MDTLKNFVGGCPKARSAEYGTSWRRSGLHCRRPIARGGVVAGLSAKCRRSGTGWDT